MLEARRDGCFVSSNNLWSVGQDRLEIGLGFALNACQTNILHFFQRNHNSCKITSWFEIGYCFYIPIFIDRTPISCCARWTHRKKAPQFSGASHMCQVPLATPRVSFCLRLHQDHARPKFHAEKPEFEAARPPVLVPRPESHQLSSDAWCPGHSMVIPRGVFFGLF